MASISFKNVEKTYEGGNTVVPNFNLDIKYKIFAKDTIFDILEAEEINDLLWAGKIKNEEKR